MPTGAAKSLCYQLPSFSTRNAPLCVVSPLIALMHYQVAHLEQNECRHCF